jgi:hypothetical protein
MRKMDQHERVADAAVAGGWLLWLTSHALELMPLLQFASLLAAIAASVAATLYYIKRRNA